MEIEVIIEGKHFTAEIEESETGRAFCALLPMTLNMSDLNGNEKYHYLSEVFPTSSRYYAAVEPGDLMIYGNSCVLPLKQVWFHVVCAKICLALQKVRWTIFTLILSELVLSKYCLQVHLEQTKIL